MTGVAEITYIVLSTSCFGVAVVFLMLFSRSVIAATFVFCVLFSSHSWAQEMEGDWVGESASDILMADSSAVVGADSSGGLGCAGCSRESRRPLRCRTCGTNACCSTQGTCSSCSSASWDHDFFSCDRTPLFGGDECSPSNCSAYAGVFGGFVSVENFNRELVTDALLNIVEDQGASLLDDHAFGMAIGRRVHPRARLEAEFTIGSYHPGSWHVNEFTAGVLTSSTVVAASGSIDTYSGMFNMVFDLSARRVGCANLYAGGGLGVLHAEGDITTATNLYEFSDASFAYQFIGGVNFPIRERVELFSEYRYVGADGIQVTDTTGAVSLGDFQFDAHNVFMGIRFYR